MVYFVLDFISKIFTGTSIKESEKLLKLQERALVLNELLAEVNDEIANELENNLGYKPTLEQMRDLALDPNWMQSQDESLVDLLRLNQIYGYELQGALAEIRDLKQQGHWKP